VTMPMTDTQTADFSEWSAGALCSQQDADALFARGAAQNLAKILCRSCPVQIPCLADALDNRVEFGVWGGLTERERRALLKRRPDVTSWRRFLAHVKDARDAKAG
jgi:WhiB family transcriptional regulator, redox-sensing transcriptional regulator